MGKILVTAKDITPGTGLNKVIRQYECADEGEAVIKENELKLLKEEYQKQGRELVILKLQRVG